MVPKGVRTITVREAYQVNIQVPAAQKVPVNAITANKKGRRHTIITPRLVRYQVNVQQTEVLYGPVCGGCQNGVSVWSGNRGVPPPSGGGCCTMVPKGTRVTWVKEWRQRTEYDRSQVPALTAQLPQYHNTKAGDGYKANLYTTKGPDSDGNVVIDTEEDGTLIDATQDQLDSQYQHPDRSYMQDSTKFDNSKVLDHQNGTD